MRRWLLCALLALCGCASAPARVGEPPPTLKEPEETKYQQTLNHYTAHQEVYALFDTRMFVAMTFESPTFREARTRRVAEFQAWPQSLLDQRLADERAQADAGIQFFMGVHMNNRHYEDFDKKDSVWRIALVTPAGEVTPVKLERQGRSTLDQRALYPYLDDFWVGYVITFPKLLPDNRPVVPPGTTQLLVRVAGALGKAELTFPAE